MQCPSDQAVLQMTERHGIEIDYCPTCRGVWLDRGELDKIIEKAGVEATPPAPAPVPAPDPRTESAGYPPQAYAAPPGTAYPPQPGYPQYPNHPRSPDSPDDYHDGGQQQYGDPRNRRRRKGGFLGDLFDF